MRIMRQHGNFVNILFWRSQVKGEGAQRERRMGERRLPSSIRLSASGQMRVSARRLKHRDDVARARTLSYTLVNGYLDDSRRASLNSGFISCQLNGTRRWNEALSRLCPLE